MSETEERIAQLLRDLRYLWRPEDRLLRYVEARLVELARLGVSPQGYGHKDPKGDADE
jgi:hypothetical protein